MLEETEPGGLRRSGAKSEYLVAIDPGQRRRLRLTRLDMKTVGTACFVAMTVGTSLLFADPLPAEIILARRLFVEARAREEAKDWTTAAAKLREAISIKETAGLRFHLAYCEEQQGLLVESLVDYERSEDLQNAEDFRSQLPAKKESLHKRIPTLTIVMPRDVENATLTVDSHVMPASFLGNPVSLNPGRHTAQTSAPGRVPFTVDLVLSEGDAVVTNATMAPVAKPMPPVPSPISTTNLVILPTKGPPDRPEASPARVVLLITEAAISAGGMTLGIGYTLAASSADDRAEEGKTKLVGNSSEACRVVPATATQMAMPTAQNAPICSALLETRKAPKVTGSLLGWASSGQG